MRRVLKGLGYAAVVLAALLLVAGQLGLLRGRVPDGLGVHEGRLREPSTTPNSVSSQAGLWPRNPMHERSLIAPLALRGNGPETIAHIKAIVETMPGAKVVDSRDDYLYVQFTTRWLRFVDDAEFWFDPAAGVVQVRSASRVGRKDFGVNRRRIEDIRARLQGG